MKEKTVGVLGAQGQVGRQLLPLLSGAQWHVAAFSRSFDSLPDDMPGVSWHVPGDGSVEPVDCWVSTAPIWELPGYFKLFAESGAKRVVALSSTSVFSKEDSPDSAERGLAQRLVEGEHVFKDWCVAHGVEWVILRPTMIYGYGRDHNISSLLRFIQKFGFIPVLGAARGLRQPVHVEDVASACVAAVSAGDAANCDYNLSGGETLSYREMCNRLFAGIGRKSRIVTIPHWLFCLVSPLACLLSKRFQWLVPMFERMNRDLVFDHSNAARCLGFCPRSFKLSQQDLDVKPSRILP